MKEYNAKLKIDNMDEWIEYLKDLQSQGIELQNKETKEINPLVFKFDFKLRTEKILT